MMPGVDFCYEFRRKASRGRPEGPRAGQNLPKPVGDFRGVRPPLSRAAPRGTYPQQKEKKEKQRTKLGF